MSTGLTTRPMATAMASPSHDEPSFDGLVNMGDALIRTGFLPAHIKNGVSFAAIVLMGRELGMGTMAACRKLQVIKGTVTERADSQLARFKSAGGKSQFKELTEARAVLWLRHPNGDEHTETFSIEDAKRAGLSSNDNYSKHPKAMLRSRAITAGLKSIGWEGAVGIYDPDEIADDPAAAAAHAPAGGVYAKFVKPSSPQHAEPVEVPDQPARATSEDMANARLAINRAKTADALDALRERVTKRLLDEFFTDAQADELFVLIDGRREILTGEEVAS